MTQDIQIHHKKYWSLPHKLLVKSTVLFVTLQTFWVNCPDCITYLTGGSN